MTALSPENFSLLMRYARRAGAISNALRAIGDAERMGQIQDVVLAEAKRTLSRAVDEVWRKRVQEPYFYSGRYQTHPPEAVALHRAVNLLSLHAVVAVSRRLARATAEGPAIEAMRAVVAEALPLANAVAALEDKVVMSKTIRTCPCCFRRIAVQDGTMARHGYRWTRDGSKTLNCQGVRFSPLEVSNEGLVWVIDNLRGRLSALQAIYAERQTVTALPTLRGHLVLNVVKGAAEWPQLYRSYELGIERDIRAIERDLPVLEARLRDWKPLTSPAPLARSRKGIPRR